MRVLCSQDGSRQDAQCCAVAAERPSRPLEPGVGHLGYRAGESLPPGPQVSHNQPVHEPRARLGSCICQELMHECEFICDTMTSLPGVF